MRKPMITRTMISTTVTAMCVDTTIGEVVTNTFNIPRTFKDDTKLLKAVKAYAENDTLKVVQIISSEKTEKLYGMSEEAFMEHATELDPKTRKPIN